MYEGDTGVIIKINNGELHDLNLQVFAVREAMRCEVCVCVCG